MKATFVIDVQVDVGLVALDARKRGRDFNATLEQLLSRLECTLHDVCRWQDAVEPVGVRHQVTSPAEVS